MCRHTYRQCSLPDAIRPDLRQRVSQKRRCLQKHGDRSSLAATQRQTSAALSKWNANPFVTCLQGTRVSKTGSRSVPQRQFKTHAAQEEEQVLAAWAVMTATGLLIKASACATPCSYSDAVVVRALSGFAR